MVQNEQLSVHLYASGFCTAHDRVVNPRGRGGSTRFYAVWALIRHRTLGNVLFDTGYTPAFRHATGPFPDRLYRWATPVNVHAGETAQAHLLREGIDPGSVRYIVVSHFHADHIGGLRDFPNAQFLCTEAAWQEVRQSRGWSAVRKGILRRLLPPDFHERVLTVESVSRQTTDLASGLTLFEPLGQGDLQLVHLPGHARGMLGFLVRGDYGSLLFANDASWSRHTFDQKILPLPVVRLFFDSWADFIRTQQQLRAYRQQHPDTEILFTHCPDTLQHLAHPI